MPSRSRTFKNLLLATVCAASALVTPSAWAQASSLLWRTNVGAHVFAVDAQTNVYAYAGTNIIQLNAEGQPLQTNAICPLPGIFQRDGAGNFYIAGNIDGTQDFGGITLVGGWTNLHRKDLNQIVYQPGYPTCFVAKYDANGALQWVTGFGKQGDSTQAVSNKVTDVLLDPSGGVYAGYLFQGAGLGLAHIGATGQVDWDKKEISWSYQTYLTVKFGAATSTNSFYNSPSHYSLGACQLDRSGQANALGMMVSTENDWITNSKPVTDASGHLCLIAKLDSTAAHVLASVGPGVNYWSREVPRDLMWTLAADLQGNLYLGGTNGALAQYSSTGEPVWQTRFDQPVLEMLVDAAGNRFVTLADGSIGRLQSDDTAQLVIITTDPVSQTVFAGDNVTLSVEALGTAPIYYTWRLDGEDLLGANGSQLQLNAVTPAQAGTYTVLVTNSRNAVVSAPAEVRVRSVAYYFGSQMLTNGDYTFASNPTLTLRSAFPNGQIYYTLDGSTPNQSSTLYSGAFVLRRDATLKAIAYSADGQQSALSEVVQASVSHHTLSVSVSGGGSVIPSPFSGPYPKTTTVTLSAVPEENWSFLYWLEDASGSDPVTTVTMEEDRVVTAVFGTNEPSGILPPELAWRTNLGAHVFAVDAETNVYAYAGTNIIVLNAEGQPVQTNSFCPLPGMAVRDSAGNYYIGGNFDGSQDFGGITLVGGWTNGWYRPGYPTCFVAKYASSGSLQWVTSFGVQGKPTVDAEGYGNSLTDLVLDPSGGLYAGYVLNGGMGRGMAHVSATGHVDWRNAEIGVVVSSLGVKLGSATETNCSYISIPSLPGDQVLTVHQVDRSSQVTRLGEGTFGESNWATNSKPVTDALGRLYLIGKGFVQSAPHALTIVGPQTDCWRRQVPQELMWTLAKDPQGNVYLGGANGALAQYSGEGYPLWSTVFNQPVLEMLVDGSGNRFVTLADGSIARLQSDSAPSTQARMSVGASNDGVRFSLMSGPQQAWKIQLSTNLVDWRTLGIVTNNTGLLKFGDLPLKNSSGRFYRALPVVTE